MEQELSVLVRERMDALNQFQTDVRKDLGDVKNDVSEVVTKCKGYDAEILKLKGWVGGRAPSNSRSAAESLGALVTKSRDVQAFAGSNTSGSRIRGSVTVAIGGSFVTKATITTGTTGLIVRTETDPIDPLPRLPLTVIDLLPKRPLKGGVLKFTRQTGAHPVAGIQVLEGDAKAEGALTFEEVTLTTETLAVWIPASVQALRDIDGLELLIDTELLYAVKVLEDNEVLNGTGAGHLTGLLPTATVVVPDAADTPIDAVARMLMNLITRGYQPTGVVLNPADYLSMALAKDADENYILGPPTSAPATTLWGIPLALTTALAAGTAMAGDFRRAELRYSEDANVQISTEHADFFIRNLVAIRAEESALLAIKRPDAFVKTTLPAPVVTP